MYTKGEWVITRDTKRGYIAVRSVDDSPVCHIYSIIPNAEANANLIASAPDCYEKLIKICAWLEKLIRSAEKQLATCSRFATLSEALEFDIKNYKTTLKDIRLATDKAEGK